MEIVTFPGNVAQMEIWVKIEALNHEIWGKNQLLTDYQSVEKHLQKEQKKLFKNLAHLRNRKTKAVSLIEFNTVKQNFDYNTYKLAEVQEAITKVETYIENANREIAELSKELKEKETAILEFNHEKR